MFRWVWALAFLHDQETAAMVEVDYEDMPHDELLSLAKGDPFAAEAFCCRCQSAIWRLQAPGDLIYYTHGI